MKINKLWVKRSLLFASAVLISAGLLGLYIVKLKWPSTIPQTSGEVKLPCLKNPVNIWRDSYGIPHIEGANNADVACAFGYTMAQDRSFQIDIWRNIKSVWVFRPRF